MNYCDYGKCEITHTNICCQDCKPDYLGCNNVCPDSKNGCPKDKCIWYGKVLKG